MQKTNYAEGSTMQKKIIIVSILKVVTDLFPSQVSAAWSGGVSRSDCRHVMKITTPYAYLKLAVNIVSAKRTIDFYESISTTLI